MAALRAKQAELQAVEDGLAALQGQYNDALRKKGDLEASVENTNKKLERATTVRALYYIILKPTEKNEIAKRELSCRTAFYDGLEQPFLSPPSATSDFDLPREYKDWNRRGPMQGSANCTHRGIIFLILSGVAQWFYAGWNFQPPLFDVTLKNRYHEEFTERLKSARPPIANPPAPVAAAGTTPTAN